MKKFGLLLLSAMFIGCGAPAPDKPATDATPVKKDKTEMKGMTAVPNEPP